jgi:hypothetical protein
METKKVFTFSSLNQTFKPSFTKIETTSGSSGLLDSCELARDENGNLIYENGKVVCGRQIKPISDEWVRSLFPS